MVLLGEKETVTASCGHEHEVDLSELAVDRRAGRKRFFEEKGLCGECFAESSSAEREKQRDAWVKARRAEVDQAVEAWSTAAGMPSLDGSPKQASYAAAIRMAMVVAAHKELVFEGAHDEDWFTGNVEGPARRVGQARWWLDNKDMAPSDLPVLLDAAVNDPRNRAECENDA
ncbi:MAG: hypothetical protein QM621_08065 [Aeromicrobium sp.]|uniref:hypothetical protein n=1 Tax=Aeromicrobium sp. TaxID=1871063 RepID=UPI0039E35F2C